eukprot:TRINITY_DN30642_c0_g1_i1.p1 TRINITY_DN30642_c0_g1~~TRINITY_DN30642_c0_g1_i1.p1  ORF type:complete len:274 (-),score=45.87 TRINITY_DN30642_c0_g1_i1:210-1031(-)
MNPFYQFCCCRTSCETFCEIECLAQPVVVESKPLFSGGMPHVMPADFELATVSRPPQNRGLPTLLLTDQTSVGELNKQKLAMLHGSGDFLVGSDSTCGDTTFCSEASNATSSAALDDEGVAQVVDDKVLRRVLSSYRQQVAREDVLRERREARDREAEAMRVMEAEERATVQLRQAKMQEVLRRLEDQKRLSLFLERHGFLSVERKRRSSFLPLFDYPLHVAVRLADVPIVRALLAQGVDEKQKNSSGLTARMVAQQENKDGSHDEVLNMLAA